MENKYHIGQKTLREMEKLLVTSNVSFSHNVFHSFISLMRQNATLCGNGLNRFADTKLQERFEFSVGEGGYWTGEKK